MTSAAERKRLQRQRKAEGAVTLPHLDVPAEIADEFADRAVEVGLLTEIEAETDRANAVMHGALVAWHEWLADRQAKREAAMNNFTGSH